MINGIKAWIRRLKFIPGGTSYTSPISESVGRAALPRRQAGSAEKSGTRITRPSEENLVRIIGEPPRPPCR